MLGNARTALAGPPLLGHPYEIGQASSLPWQGRQWWPGRSDYDVANLVSETMAILTPSTPVLVRMETMRRGAIYATRDRVVAEQLLAAVLGRARKLEAQGKADANAWLTTDISPKRCERSGISPDVTNSPFPSRTVGGWAHRRPRWLFVDPQEPRAASGRSVDRVRRRVDRAHVDGPRRLFQEYVEHAAKARPAPLATRS